MFIFLQKEYKAIGLIKIKADTLKTLLPKDEGTIDLIKSDTIKSAEEIHSISKEYVEKHIILGIQKIN